MKEGSVGIVVAVALMGGASITLAGSRSGGGYTVNDTVDGGGLCVTSANYSIDGSVGGSAGYRATCRASSREARLHRAIDRGDEPAPCRGAQSGAGVQHASTQWSGRFGRRDGHGCGWEQHRLGDCRIPDRLDWTFGRGHGRGRVVEYRGDRGGHVSGRDRIVRRAGAGHRSRQLWNLRERSDPGLVAGVLLSETNNELGKACSTNCTGQNNLYTYTADLNPTDPNSVLQIVAFSNQPSSRVVCFRNDIRQPRLSSAVLDESRQRRVDKPAGAIPLTGLPGGMSLSDTNAAAGRFYRVGVQVP